MTTNLNATTNQGVEPDEKPCCETGVLSDEALDHVSGGVYLAVAKDYKCSAWLCRDCSKSDRAHAAGLLYCGIRKFKCENCKHYSAGYCLTSHI